MKMMLGATSCASWNSCRTRASDSPGTPHAQPLSQVQAFAPVPQDMLALLERWLHTVLTDPHCLMRP